MMCDLIFAADDREVRPAGDQAGVIPGIGGTQRLTRLVGRAKAMDLVLTGGRWTRPRPNASGLVARVVPAGELLAEAQAAAATIAGYGRSWRRCWPGRRWTAPGGRRCATASCSSGALFHALFATEDQREGMPAFLEKRPARFTGR